MMRLRHYLKPLSMTASLETRMDKNAAYVGQDIIINKYCVLLNQDMKVERYRTSP